ncbi:unnamed protein product [Mytilus edulis]|uniref:Uncharacterized protein n=1 Tax=Mytilus edulis TaxID=6550 RepID=A0A8S3SZI2_MYTED|nr:unnamed protein product [Mytilus edulis]
MTTRQLHTMSNHCTAPYTNEWNMSNQRLSYLLSQDITYADFSQLLLFDPDISTPNHSQIFISILPEAPILPVPLMQTNRTEIYQNRSTISISNLSPIVPPPSFCYQNQSTISISNLSPILPHQSFSHQNHSAVSFSNFPDTPTGSMSYQNQSSISTTKQPAILPVAAYQSILPKTCLNQTDMPTPNQSPLSNAQPNQSSNVKETSLHNSSEFEHVTSTQPAITTPTNKVMTSPPSDNPLVAAFQLPYYTGASDFCDKNTPQLTPTPVRSVRNLINDIEKKIKSSGSSGSSRKGTPLPAKSSPRQQTIINSSTSQLPESQLPTVTTVLEVGPTISTPIYQQDSSIEGQLPPSQCTNTENLSVTSSSQPLINQSTSTSNQPETASRLLDQMLSVCLSSPSLSELSVHSSLLNEDEATELQSILRDSFISMTTLPSSDNEKQNSKSTMN